MHLFLTRDFVIVDVFLTSCIFLLFYSHGVGWAGVRCLVLSLVFSQVMFSKIGSVGVDLFTIVDTFPVTEQFWVKNSYRWPSDSAKLSGSQARRHHFAMTAFNEGISTWSVFPTGHIQYAIFGCILHWHGCLQPLTQFLIFLLGILLDCSLALVWLHWRCLSCRTTDLLS